MRTILFILRQLKQPMNCLVSAVWFASTVIIKIDKNIIVNTVH